MVQLHQYLHSTSTWLVIMYGHPKHKAYPKCTATHLLAGTHNSNRTDGLLQPDCAGKPYAIPLSPFSKTSRRTNQRPVRYWRTAQVSTLPREQPTLTIPTMGYSEWRHRIPNA